MARYMNVFRCSVPCTHRYNPAHICIGLVVVSVLGWWWYYFVYNNDSVSDAVKVTHAFFFVEYRTCAYWGWCLWSGCEASYAYVSYMKNNANRRLSTPRTFTSLDTACNKHKARPNLLYKVGFRVLASVVVLVCGLWHPYTLPWLAEGGCFELRLWLGRTAPPSVPADVHRPGLPQMGMPTWVWRLFSSPNWFTDP